MTTDEKIDALLIRARKRVSLDFEREISEVRSWCESPIEELFAMGLLEHGGRISKIHVVTGRTASVRTSLPDPLRTPSKVLAFLVGPLVVAFQHRVELPSAAYRLDFAVLSSDGTAINVELDGHDFHERTKDQAKRDKARDRALTTEGWIVLRFTGSEVYEDVAGCMGEINKVLRARRKVVA